MNVLKYVFSPTYRKSWRAGKLIRKYFEDYGRVQQTMSYTRQGLKLIQGKKNGKERKQESESCVALR